MNRYIDAHCHIFEASHFVGVGAICNSATIADWPAVLSVINQEQNIFGAVGIHPWYISDLPNDWKNALRKLLSLHPDLMVGEVGLDKFHDDMPQQIDVFIAQLKIAYDLGRGICVHCVGAWDKLQQILKEYGAVLPRFLLMHCYSGPAQDIKKMAEKYNMYFSYGVRNLHDGNRLLATPLDRILAETDSDNPADVIDIVNRVADILNIAPDKMADIIYNNTIRMLNS